MDCPLGAHCFNFCRKYFGSEAMGGLASGSGADLERAFWMTFATSPVVSFLKFNLIPGSDGPTSPDHSGKDLYLPSA